MNKQEEIQTAMLLIQNNLSDHVTELAKMNSISKEEAEVRLQEILANNKKIFEATSYQQEQDVKEPKKPEVSND